MDIFNIIFLAIIFIISISLHEYAHAWMSFKLGDPTPKIQGRLTPNPLVHIDPIGFLLIFIIHFGWGKPVIVNPSYYKNKLKDELMVSLAGPIMNLILAITGTSIMLIYIKIIGVVNLFNNDPIIQFRQLFAWINIALAIFNLIPIYPLDGYRMIKYITPKIGYRMETNRKYIMIVLLILIFAPRRLGLPSDPIGSIIIHISQMIYSIIYTILSFIFF